MFKIALILLAGGIFGLLRFLFGGDSVTFYVGLGMALAGMNFSIFSPPCIIVGILSCVATFFFGMKALAIGVILMAAWTFLAYYILGR